MKKPSRERRGRYDTICYDELLLTETSSLEDFIKQDLDTYFGRRLVLRERTRYIEENKLSRKESHYRTDIMFGFKKIDTSNFSIIGFKDGLQGGQYIYMLDKGFPHNGDFLYMTTQYFLLKKLWFLGAKNIQINVFLSDDYLPANNEQELSDYFDDAFSSSLVINSESDKEIMVLGDITPRYCSRRGSEFITYFQQPYNMAWKMKGFPKEWTM